MDWHLRERHNAKMFRATKCADANAPRHIGETNCVAGHIGFEVRRETGKE